MTLASEKSAATANTLSAVAWWQAVLFFVDLVTDHATDGGTANRTNGATTG